MEQTVGLDSVIFIYLLEESEPYLESVRQILRPVEEGKIRAVLSRIGLIEILTGPKRRGRFDLAARYKDMLLRFPNLILADLNERVVDLASGLRADYGLATPDAIHLATAIDFGAEKFITNDKGLKKIKEIAVELL